MKKILFWLICISFLRGVIYLLITPPWQAPDETTHFQFMELLTQRSLGEIRKIDLMILNDQKYLELEGKILQSMKKHRAWEYVGMPVPDPFPSYFYQAPFFSGSAAKIFRPPLYYLLGAGILKLLNPQGLERRLYVARLYSLILSLGTVVVSCLIGFLVFKDEIYALMTGIFVSFLPQFMVIGSSVNSDNLVYLLSSTFLLYAVFILDNKKSGWYLILIPFFLLMLFLSGKTGLILVPVGIFLFVFRILTQKSKEPLYLLTLSLLGLILAFIFFADLLPGSVLETFFISKTEFITSGQKLPVGLSFYQSFLTLLFKSFWFVGGWMAILWNHWVYAGLSVLTVLSICGLLLIVVKRLAKLEEDGLPSNPILFIMTLSVLMSFLASLFFYGWVKEMLAQGRYLFPVLPAIGILFIIGLKRICHRSIISYFPYGFIIFMVSLDLYTLLGRLLPYYHF